jgi:hypothetical protein
MHMCTICLVMSVATLAHIFDFSQDRCSLAMASAALAASHRTFGVKTPAPTSPTASAAEALLAVKTQASAAKGFEDTSPPALAVKTPAPSSPLVSAAEGFEDTSPPALAVKTPTSPPALAVKTPAPTSPPALAVKQPAPSSPLASATKALPSSRPALAVTQAASSSSSSTQRMKRKIQALAEKYHVDCETLNSLADQELRLQGTPGSKNVAAAAACVAADSAGAAASAADTMKCPDELFDTQGPEEDTPPCVGAEEEGRGANKEIFCKQVLTKVSVQKAHELAEQSYPASAEAPLVVMLTQATASAIAAIPVEELRIAESVLQRLRVDGLDGEDDVEVEDADADNPKAKKKKSTVHVKKRPSCQQHTKDVAKGAKKGSPSLKSVSSDSSSSGKAFATLFTRTLMEVNSNKTLLPGLTGQKRYEAAIAYVKDLSAERRYALLGEQVPAPRTRKGCGKCHYRGCSRCVVVAP